MRRTPWAGIVPVVVVGLGLAACAGSDPALRPSTATTPTTRLATLGFSDADDGRSVDVAVGQRMTVILHSSEFVFGAPSDATVLRADGSATVTPGGATCVRGPGSGCGTVVASFVGLARGDAELRADRTACAEPTCAPADAEWRLSVHVVTAVVGGSATTTTVDLGADVRGTVMLSPVCPVERLPPDPACAPRAGRAIVELARPDGIVVAQVRTGDDGAFVISVSPGTYSVLAFGSQGEAAGVGGGCQVDPPEVIVELGTSTTVIVSCDTGIR